MFYSHELLTNRQYGVATIWLVATLGSKSTLKKVTRKAILDVDIPKACKTITNPDTPLALRLQASLLYGVSRVHFQQCNYVLNDTQSFRDNMRGVVQVMKELEIDPDVGRTRPEQLNLPEDPGFLPDLDLTFDLSGFDLPSDSHSSRASSVLSSHIAPSSQTSYHGNDLEETGLQLDLPSLDSPSGFGGLSVGGRNSVGDDSAIIAALDDIMGESPFIEDPGFEIAEDGSIVQPARPQSKTGPVTDDGRAVSESGFSARVRDEHDAGVAGLEEPQRGYDDEGINGMDDDYDHRLPSPAPVPSSNQNSHQRGDQQPGRDGVEAERQSVSTETATAPQRRGRPGRLVQIDKRTELQNKDLGEWNTNYVDNMAQLERTKLSRATAQGKKNAAFWVLGQGIGGVQAIFGEDREPHPLAVFSGQDLLDALLGPNGQRSRTSSKRARSSSPSSEDERRVRARHDDDENVARGPLEDGQAMGFDDDQGIMGQGDEYNLESEIGRRAGSLIPDVASSLPWNRSASRQGSIQRLIGTGPGISSSAGGPGSGLRFGPSNVMAGWYTRMASASPLVGKGRQIVDLNDLHYLAAQQQAGQEDIMLDAEAFEQYGPAAAVDTQTAAQSQWMRSTLENEAQNFLGFVEAQLIERGEDGHVAESVTLDQLLPAAENSAIVAAQALLHVLALTTKGFLKVEQEDDFGDIVLMAVDVVGLQATYEQSAAARDEEGEGDQGEVVGDSQPGLDSGPGKATGEQQRDVQAENEAADGDGGEADEALQAEPQAAEGDADEEDEDEDDEL